MLSILYNLLIGNFCKHKWVTIYKAHSMSGGKVDQTFYHLKCEKCGNLKEKVL